MNSNLKFWEDLKSGRFASMVKESSKGQSLNNSREAYHVLKPLFAQQADVEQAYFIFFDGQNRVLSIEKLFSGSITAAAIYPREVVKRLITLRSSAFLMSHNHPSGNTDPSPEDQSITMQVGIATRAIHVAFHDHMIIGDGYFSMADAGWMKKIQDRLTELMNPITFNYP